MNCGEYSGESNAGALWKIGNKEEKESWYVGAHYDKTESG